MASAHVKQQRRKAPRQTRKLACIAIRAEHIPEGSIWARTPLSMSRLGLVLLYLGRSMFCPVINEHLATLIRLRATTLATGIKQLLDDPMLRTEFYNHGLLGGTKGGSTAEDTSTQAHPSYIS